MRALDTSNNLVSWLRKEHRLLPEVLNLTVDITKELAAYHSRGRILNDLRPENVLIDFAGHAQLLDLGSVPTPGSVEAAYGRSSDEALIDLYRTLSPEQVAWEGSTSRSNLFSLGVLFYEVLTGISPFRDSTPLATANRILNFEPPPVTELEPEITSGVSKLISRLLAKDPKDRPPSAVAVAGELEALVKDGSSAMSASAAAVVGAGAAAGATIIGYIPFVGGLGWRIGSLFGFTGATASVPISEYRGYGSALRCLCESPVRSLADSASDDPAGVGEEIEHLYDEIIAMTREEAEVNPWVQSEELKRAYARLLELQTVEARQFRERFEASLEMPIDAGAKILARARALREQLEDSTSSDPSASDTDHP